MKLGANEIDPTLINIAKSSYKYTKLEKQSTLFIDEYTAEEGQ